MIQQRTGLQAADTSGARELMCIKACRRFAVAMRASAT